MRSFLTRSALTALALVMPVVCNAATSSTMIAVTASVAQTCTISAAALGFGSYDPVVANVATDLAATSTLTVACTKGATSVTIGLDNGANAVSNQRNMKGGVAGNSLAYNLFQDAGRATAWDNATHKYALPSPTSKAPQTLTIYGTVPKNQDVSVDSYSDTVTATINY